MKKIITITFLCLLIITGWGAAALEPENYQAHTFNGKTHSLSLYCSSKPMILERAESIIIELKEMTSQLIEPHRPVLPLIIKTYQIPSTAQNITITCTPQGISTMILTKKIMAACIAPLSQLTQIHTAIKDDAIYNSTSFYPDRWYHSTIGAGRTTKGDAILFVKIICYPVRYSPATNSIEYTSSFAITLTYDDPVAAAPTDESSDLLIIAPKSFQSKLQPLIDFKNTKGLKTTFKAVEEILAQYDGTDPPEQVKYFIKEAYDTWGISYVLLVGGLKSNLYANDKDTRSAGWTDWWVPVRYVNIPQGDDEGCLSDLYYGCLYNATGGFDSWDSNGDGVYAAWNAPDAPQDTFDLYPEVHVGRLPVTTQRELGNVVQKIITYESSSPQDKPWYKNFIGIGGKTFGYYEGKPDGEYLCDLTYNYTKQAIPDLNLIPVYSTNKNTSGLVPIIRDIQKAFSQGAGYVDFQGHGNPLVWDTIWCDGTYPDDWCGGISLYNFLRIRNGEKLPIVVVGGCHNGMYNVSLLKTMSKKTSAQYFCYGLPVPVCFSWGLVVKYPGGAIASTGCTGYGIGGAGDPTDDLSAELESNFFYMIGHNSTHFAETHGQAIRKYLSQNVVGPVDAYCITIWAAFGDPSLLFGGYSS